MVVLGYKFSFLSIYLGFFYYKFVVFILKENICLIFEWSFLKFKWYFIVKMIVN